MVVPGDEKIQLWKVAFHLATYQLEIAESREERLKLFREMNESIEGTMEILAKRGDHVRVDRLMAVRRRVREENSRELYN